MSKRTRHSGKQNETYQIEWLKHRTGYPSPEERKKIIRMRKELTMEYILLVMMKGKASDSQFQALVKKYGAEEVERVSRVLSDTMHMSSRIAEDAKNNRDYRLRYSLYGAGLKIYTAKEIDEMYDRNMGNLKDSLMTSGIPSMGEEMEEQLLIGWRDWDDLVPLAIPPRPADFSAPQPASYPSPIAKLLEFGNDINKPIEFGSETERLQWKKLAPALTRMALDPGLLNGWLTESPSWAPWHAIHALGQVQAHESAYELAQLADLENDWLSDHLPHIWADMGAGAEPALWALLEDEAISAKKRGLAAESLFMMAEDNESITKKIVGGFESILRNKKAINQRLNAYLLAFIRDLDMLDDVWATVLLAFEEDRVDTNYITLEDLEGGDDFEDE